MSKQKCTVSFIYDEAGQPSQWVCKNTFMCASVKFPMHAERCYFHTCPGRVPFIQRRQADAPETAVAAEVVAVRRCENIVCGKALADIQLKYCSRTCGSTVRKRRHRQKVRSQNAK